MEERNKAEKELKSLREQLRNRTVQEDKNRDNLRVALEKNSEFKFKQLSENLKANNIVLETKNTRIPEMDYRQN